MHDEHRTYRILDASLNRAVEGLRVCEDYARFFLDDGLTSGWLKTLRHDLTIAAADLPWTARHAARDVAGDVGTTISTPSEGRRPDAWHTCQASFSRVKEALRSLEEYGKIVSPRWAAACEQLRYQIYAAEVVLSAAHRGRERLRDAVLCVLVDGGPDETACVARCGRLLDAGADMLQLRDKSLSDRALVARGRRLAALVRERRAQAGEGAASPLLIVNDRPDLAHLSGADGVHVGQDDLTVADARAVVGPNLLVGVSTHCLADAEAAVRAGADYLGAGPTFPSRTKQFDAFPGLDYLRELTAATSLPFYAIGGIGPDNIAAVRAAGARRVAVGGAATGDNPALALGAIRAALRAHRV
jgi:thiamine-phosphate pyrophosphorylase